MAPDDEPERRSAPPDPFGQSSSPQQVARDFTFVRAHAFLESEGEPRRYSDLCASDRDAFHPADEPPAMVLFVSHRWQTPTHPDPSGRETDIVRDFLRTVGLVAAAASSPPDARTAIVPSLHRQGVLQAAMLLGSPGIFGGPEYQWDALCTRVRRARDPGTAGDEILRRIGLWYDYSCLPNVRGFGSGPEYDAARRLVREALRQLHLLIEASNVLVLRSADDDYGSRAWYVVELAIGHPRWRHLVLRSDLVGQPISESDVLGEPELIEHGGISLMRDGEYRLELWWADRRWREDADGWAVLKAVAETGYFGLPELEAKRRVPVVITGWAPQVFPGQRNLLTGMIGRLAQLSAVDDAYGEIPAGVDIAEVIVLSLEESGLHCSEPFDRAYVGLQILYARHRRAPAFAKFYAECLRRYRAAPHPPRPYREYRDGFDVRVWYVFADEAPDSRRWQEPDWVAGRRFRAGARRWRRSRTGRLQRP